jgi:hypothetical protein
MCCSCYRSILEEIWQCTGQKNYGTNQLDGLRAGTEFRYAEEAMEHYGQVKLICVDEVGVRLGLLSVLRICGVARIPHCGPGKTAPASVITRAIILFVKLIGETSQQCHCVSPTRTCKEASLSEGAEQPSCRDNLRN